MKRFFEDFVKNLKWTSFVSKRFSRVDRKGKSAVTTFLASLGICFGVMTLIVVMAVMNGFQMSFIDSILEVSSYHITASSPVKNDSKKIKSITPFMEAQALMVSEKGKQGAALIRAVPVDVMEKDSGFRKELAIRNGAFDFSEENSIVLGSELARSIGARVGDTVNLLALSGGNDVSLLDSQRIFKVSGIFRTGYIDLNASYAFVSFESGKKYFGESAKVTQGIKLNSVKDDLQVIESLKAENPEVEFMSWRDYNRSFFGALRTEKTILFALVLLIFIVVGINIFNGMRRIVFERKTEISMFSSMGALPSSIQGIFLVQGFSIGIKGTGPGLLLGLLISNNMESVFSLLSKLTFAFQYFFTMIFNSSALAFVQENPMFAVYAKIPARNFPLEIVLISLFGLLSAVFASFAASKNILKMKVSEVLRDE